MIERMQNVNSVGVSIRANKSPENPKVKDNVDLGFMTKDYYYQGMNKLAAGVKGLEIEEEGVENAAQNGRSEIIDQILNPEEGNLKVIIK